MKNWEKKLEKLGFEKVYSARANYSYYWQKEFTDPYKILFKIEDVEEFINAFEKRVK